MLIVEEGQPAYIEEAMLAVLRRHEVNATRVHGKDCCRWPASTPARWCSTGDGKLRRAVAPAGVDAGRDRAVFEAPHAPKRQAAELLGAPVPSRPPGFCIGCPERPVFSAMKLIERESGAFHVSADIGCHTFSTLPPFNIGNTVLGYGLGLASNSGDRSDVRSTAP